MNSDLIFPNSEIEKKHLQRFFALPPEKMRVVHNGVDKAFLNADASLFIKKYGAEPFVLGVGRIEPRKNQLNLIRAVKKIKKQRLVLIGSPVSGYEAYFQKCQEEGKDFTLFLPTISHEEALLKSAYAACRLFVLQGWFETPGLVALEAALAGARLVATSGGSTREYFQNFVDYLNPADVGDIHGKILKNLSFPKANGLKDHVLKNFTWDRIAKQTLNYYNETIHSDPGL